MQGDKAGSRHFINRETLYQLREMRNKFLSNPDSFHMERASVSEKIKVVRNIENLCLTISHMLFKDGYDFDVREATKHGMKSTILRELNIPDQEDYCFVRIKAKGSRSDCYHFFYSKHGDWITPHAFRNLDGRYSTQPEKSLWPSEMMVNGRLVSAKGQGLEGSDLRFTRSIIYPAVNELTFNLLGRYVDSGETKTFTSDDPLLKTALEKAPNCKATGFVAHDYWYTFGVGKIDSMTVTCHQNAKDASGEVLAIDFDILSRETPIGKGEN